MTKRELLNAVINGTAKQADLIAYAQHELEMLDKKNANSKRVSKVDTNLVAAIKNALVQENGFISIKDMNAKYFDKEYTSQKLSYILNNVLKDDVEKTMVKRVAMFKIKDNA